MRNPDNSGYPCATELVVSCGQELSWTESLSSGTWGVNPGLGEGQTAGMPYIQESRLTMIMGVMDVCYVGIQCNG